MSKSSMLVSNRRKCVRSCGWGDDHVWSCSHLHVCDLCVCVGGGSPQLVGSVLFLVFPFELLSSHVPKTDHVTQVLVFIRRF